MFFIPLLLFVGDALALLTPEKPYYDLAEAENHFADFVQKYDKKYETEEEYYARFVIFKDNLIEINRLNEIHQTVYGVTHLSDLSYEEFKMSRFGLFPSDSTNEDELVKVPKEWIEDAPDSLDYREQNLVTPAKNQGGCQSCFAFAGVANIEGQYAMKHKELISLSEQQALDCDSLDGHCRGGYNLVNVIKELAKQGGIEREEDYPYEQKNDTCRTDKSKIAVKVTDGFEIDTKTEDTLKAALAKYGPLSVAMDAGFLSQNYHGGIIEANEYCENFLDHGVLLVGYGKEAKEGGKKYWIAKNSYGADWGDKGFFYLEIANKYCLLGSNFTACAIVD